MKTSKEKLDEAKEIINALGPKKSFKYGFTSEYTPGYTKPTLDRRKYRNRKKNKMRRKTKQKM